MGREEEEKKKRYIQYNGHNNDIEKKRFSSPLPAFLDS